MIADSINTGIGALVGLFALALAIAGIVFWIWTIVDCVKNEKPDGNDKVVWILIIVLTGWIGSLIYLFVRRPARIRELGR